MKNKLKERKAWIRVFVNPDRTQPRGGKMGGSVAGRLMHVAAAAATGGGGINGSGNTVANRGERASKRKKNVRTSELNGERDEMLGGER